ncbi:DsbA family protein [Actinokineospora iranica]|uniref:Protein-disulfide isomerase n=1 Tax=Actinokineospora iranica TaxID=1271860 RepID=A0A1G6YHY3_9PSEU|nr:thioredoxin domain-containing protein [Actinokineospora iranica]SDD89235.1 Protein-disulfide isomerase [Actinokineospora iranica]
MGGAERNARKRRQGQTGATPAARNAVAAARGAKTDRNKIIIGVLVVLVIAGAVIGGVVYTNNKKNATVGQTIPVHQVSLAVPVVREDAAVVVGKDTAKVTVDVYEDFLCPVCASFEDRYGPQLDQQLEAGTVKVRYHLVNMLATRSDPEGYSTDSANAALLAADEGKFLAFHKSLFAEQPEEGARGWTKDQLVDLGRAVGATSPAFADGVRTGKYDQLITEAYQKASTTDYLLQDLGDGRKAFGTPTIAANGTALDISDPKWLDNLIAAPQG